MRLARLKKYDTIGKKYDTTRRADPYLLSRLADHLGISSLSPYLDLACGSGNYTSALSLIGGTWTGLDQSRVMLDKAAQKSDKVKWVRGDVDFLPFSNQSFDGVSCTFAIHHFPSLRVVFSEVKRVLRSGRFVLFTSTGEQMEGYWLNEYFPTAMMRSRMQMPAFSEIEEALTSSGLSIVAVEQYSVRKNLQDFFLYSGKHRPDIYLNEKVRRGISTFSSLADESEISGGCSKLAKDIETGKIDTVIASYANDFGDYCFVVTE